MAVNNVNSSYTYSASYSKTAETKEKSETEKSGSAKASQKSETYKPDMDKIREMKADLKNNIGAYKKMVFGQIKTQAGNSDTTLKNMLKNIAGMTQEEAAGAVADDGEWGVEATANRMLDFAKSLAGDDPSKIAALRDAVKKGFGAAEKVWGGNLPDISYQTLQKVMDGFDEWEKSYQTVTA